VAAPEGEAVVVTDALKHPLERGNPPGWASEWGQDREGAFVGFTVGGVTQLMRWIPPGRFLMGSPEDEPGRFGDEGPQHEVTIARGFWLADTLCTQALWQAVMGDDNPSEFKSPDRPVETVSWDDVQEFLKRINGAVPRLELRLPTEAEWEYACRAGTKTAIWTGDFKILGERNAPALDPISWYAGNSGVDFDLDNGVDSSGWNEKQYPHTRAGTRLVGLKAVNPWGLYDMLGNVWERCTDHWHDSYDGAPADGAAWTDEESNPSDYQLVRGGAWSVDARAVRAAFRGRVRPGDRGGLLGFRCARVQA
jgi:formylglycine-generating enzyme required for sulfatase activity